MIDIHSHILYGIDDGSTSFEESIKIIEQAKKNGVTDIIFTPHYISNSEYASSYSNNTKLLYKISKEVKGVNLYLGNEYYLSDDIFELLEKGKVKTLNSSKYLLIELPFTTNINYLNDVIFKLRSNGIIPIIAHPERYLTFQKSPKSIVHILEGGALLQCNIGSLFGLYGRKSKNTIKTLLKEQYVQFMASDTHHEKEKIYNLIEKAKRIVTRLTNKQYMNEIFIQNPLNAINNEDIEFVPSIIK